jgi:hypothetical protein
MTLTFEVGLPPEGLIIRDFALTALAHIENTEKIDISPLKALVTISTTNLRRDYPEILERVSREIPRFYGPDRSARNKLLHGVERLTGKITREPSEAMKNYAERLKSEPENIEIFLRSLKKLEWNPLSDNVILWGERPTIPALQLFKLNYYAGRRTFLPFRYQNARIYLDIHTFIFSLAGGSLARIGRLRNGPTIYLSVLSPGAIGLFRILGGLFSDVGHRATPEVIFRILMAMRLLTPGMLPLKIAVINEAGNRPSLIACQEVNIDRGLLRFVEILPESVREDLRGLLTFTLKNWETNDRMQRAIVRTGYELAQAIYMSATGTLKPADTIYRVARATYATISSDFAKALSEARYSPMRSLAKFQNLLVNVERFLEECFRAP